MLQNPVILHKYNPVLKIRNLPGQKSAAGETNKGKRYDALAMLLQQPQRVFPFQEGLTGKVLQMNSIPTLLRGRSRQT